ncbi:alpha-amylase family glycosyl hydrolase [Sphingomonas sp. 1P06PA]|uniref:alpha-amylase family glycosyl hydrolase n=1 Tax=Sphingomonas sp. 1P06PA TaxID=554121 RepID=UPI0039A6329F
MTRPWWQSAVIYQVYPRSFQDSDGDGIGDLAGIIGRLDHFATLGVDAIWLSPVYPSPMADFGYDVSDYRGIDPRFGTIEDFDRLVGETHARGLKVLMDFVPNHSSDQHPWFVASRSSRDDPKRDWYIWADPATDGGPPNNWISDFGGPAWEWDEASGQYYAHAFLKEQPDLNWRNPDLRREMLETLDWWFRRGVDGFRIDVLWHMVKSAELKDNPPNPDWRPGMADMLRVHQTESTDQPEVHEIAAEMRALADRHGDRLLVGEIYLPNDRLMAYYGTRDAPGVHLPFNFALIEAEWTAPALSRIIGDYEAALPPGGWPNWVLGNHDRPRIASRVGPAQARVAAMLLLTLRGTPTLYQGDEIGLTDVDVPADRIQDPRELREPGLGLGRDPVRTPMAWDGSPNGGFTTGDPWLPLHLDWPSRNVAAQSADPQSMLSLYRRLIALRQIEPALSVGAIHLVPAAAPSEGRNGLLGYVRETGGRRVIVLLNLDDAYVHIDLPPWAKDHKLAATTLSGVPLAAGSTLELRPNEGVVFIPPRDVS